MKMDFLFRGVQINSLVIHKSNPSSLVTVSGKATHATYISLNDREIFIGPDGTFTEELALLPGLSILTLKAEDKFGHTSDKKLEVVYQESTGVVAVSNPIINTN